MNAYIQNISEYNKNKEEEEDKVKLIFVGSSEDGLDVYGFTANNKELVTDVLFGVKKLSIKDINIKKAPVEETPIEERSSDTLEFVDESGMEQLD
jgi:hypothetical protein